MIIRFSIWDIIPKSDITHTFYNKYIFIDLWSYQLIYTLNKILSIIILITMITMWNLDIEYQDVTQNPIHSKYDTFYAWNNEERL